MVLVIHRPHTPFYAYIRLSKGEKYLAGLESLAFA